MKRTSKTVARASGNGHGSGNGNRSGSGNGARATKSRNPRPLAKASGAPRTGADDGGEPRGTLIIIGGHEDKEGDKLILRALAERVGSGALVVATVASGLPAEVWGDYKRVFDELGVREVRHLHVDARQEARSDAALRVLDGATAVFFTGGDQLRITSQVGDSPVFQCLQEIYHQGATIAGTSAGAAAMPQTMLISGDSDKSTEISALGMAPGLGFVDGVVIDSHFAERGRFGRLIGAVAQNPKNLGLGIDEDTAVVVRRDQFTVIGSGAVYVLDGSPITFSSLSEVNPEGVLSVFNAKVHVLAKGDCFDLEGRSPIISQEAIEQASTAAE